MTRLLLTVVSALLIAHAPASGHTYTITTNDPPYYLAQLWWWTGPQDTLLLMPGTYVVDTVWWPLPLTNTSPRLTGHGGPDEVVLLGTGQEKPFSLGEFVYDARIHLDHLTFSGLAEVISRVDFGSGYGELRFTDNIVENCGTGSNSPGFTTTGCWGLIARNVFRNNQGCAIHTYHTSAAIEDNEIYGNGGGIWDACCTSPPTRRNHIHDNSGAAIRTGYGQGGPIEYNIIERNGTGLSVGSSFAVQHNIIRENTRGVYCGGIAMGNAAVHYNDICGNVEYNLQSVSESPITHDCTMNWWGSTDPVVIAAGIRDCNDDPALNATVVFEPFCLSPGCGPVAVEPLSWGAIKALYR